MAGRLSPKLAWELANPKWAQTLNDLLGNPLVDGFLLESLQLVAGDNVINHKLGRTLRGWLVTRNGEASTFYDKQRTNQTPDLTLVLNASAPTTLSLYVF